MRWGFRLRQRHGRSGGRLRVAIFALNAAGSATALPHCPAALIVLGFGCIQRRAPRVSPTPAICGMLDSCQQCWGTRCQHPTVSATHCLTVHSSRSRFAARLNSGVRRHWSKVGWRFLFRQIHWPFSGRLRSPLFTASAAGKPITSALASRLPHSVCRWLRWFRAAGFTGQASSCALWHHQLSLRSSRRAVSADGRFSAKAA